MESKATESPSFIRVPKKRRRKGQVAKPSQTLRDGIRKNESSKKKPVKSLKKRESLKKSVSKIRTTVKSGKKVSFS